MQSVKSIIEKWRIHLSKKLPIPFKGNKKVEVITILKLIIPEL